jgi:hypothetical protein
MLQTDKARALCPVNLSLTVCNVIKQNGYYEPAINYAYRTHLRQRKNDTIAHTFTYMIDLDYFTLETKSIFVR